MKQLNKTLFSLLISFLICNGLSCSNFSTKTAPYLISGQMVTEDSRDYEMAGFDFSFFNKSEKTVSSFTLVFYLFDEDGNPPISGKNSITLQVKETVGPLEKLEMCASIDKYLTYVPSEPFTADFIYVSKIAYTDGSQWSDPYGLYGL